MNPPARMARRLLSTSTLNSLKRPTGNCFSRHDPGDLNSALRFSFMLRQVRTAVDAFKHLARNRKAATMRRAEKPFRHSGKRSTRRAYRGRDSAHGAMFALASRIGPLFFARLASISFSPPNAYNQRCGSSRRVRCMLQFDPASPASPT
jgi:hypothetical protein